MAKSTPAAETFTPAEQQALQTGDTTALKAEAEEAAPETAEQPEATAEAPEAAEEPAPKQGKSKTVPHQAFHEEREKRKAIEAELSPLKENYAKLEGRLQAILDMQRQPAQQTQPAKPQGPPKADENIFGWADHINKKLEQIEGGVGQFQQQNEQQRVVATLRNAYEQDATRFEATAPDFKDAYAHLIAGRDSELQMLGVENPAQRQAMIEMEELQIVAQAVKANRSPAEIAYSLAKARGYQGKAPAGPATEQPRNSSGQFTAAEKVQQTAAKQAAAKSLSAVNGGSGGAEVISVPDLLALSQEDFEAFMEKNKKAGNRPLAKIMGAN